MGFEPVASAFALQCSGFSKIGPFGNSKIFRNLWKSSGGLQIIFEKLCNSLGDFQPSLVIFGSFCVNFNNFWNTSVWDPLGFSRFLWTDFGSVPCNIILHWCYTFFMYIIKTVAHCCN